MTLYPNLLSPAGIGIYPIFLTTSDPFDKIFLCLIYKGWMPSTRKKKHTTKKKYKKSPSKQTSHPINFHGKYQVICQDALHWLSKQPPHSLGNIITGIPDLDEVDLDLPSYLKWFQRAVSLCFTRVKKDGYCILMNTDRKYPGQWIDKSYLISKVAHETSDLKLKWHKIILLRGVNKAHLQRPTYQHFLCFSYRGKPGATTPDVIECGGKLYANASCLIPTQLAIKFVKRYSPHSVIVDPFVGQGTTLIQAQQMGFPSAIGLDIDPEQCTLTRQALQ